MEDQEIIKKIKTIADNYSDVPNSLIEFEITERSFAEISADILSELKNMGFSLSLDDFGTGYSSLNFLHKKPIDSLKIDKSFISDMENKKIKLILKAIINLSHDLNLEVIAEGVETKRQYQEIRSLNCDYGQGYYFYKPLSAAKTKKLLK